MSKLLKLSGLDKSSHEKKAKYILLDKKRKFSGHHKILYAGIFLFCFTALAVYQANKKMPVGTDFISKSYLTKSEDIKFYYDLSYLSLDSTVHEQHIFDTLIDYINNANHYILIDMFLFNDYMNKDVTPYRSLSNEITDALLKKIKKQPDIKIDLITDPINTVYGGAKSTQLELLKKNGVNVIISDLTPLRDSNFFYSFFARVFFNWLPNSETGGWLRNPFTNNGERVTLRSYLALLNFKANHRKVFVADSGNDMISMLMSANPHDGSSAHSNTALSVRGDFWQAIWLSESAVAKMSHSTLQSPPIFGAKQNNNNGDANINLELITENKIKKSLLLGIENTIKNDQIYMAMFYLADRDIINTLIGAAKRGVDIKLILDPNKDAFGYEKNGIPNREVTEELQKKTNNKIQIRWYDTHGEQFHSKLTYITHQNGPSSVILGSANLTRRNIDNYNLESNISVVAKSSTVFMQDVGNYFNKIWNNENQHRYTVDYNIYQDKSFFKYLIYRIQEATGLCSF